MNCSLDDLKRLCWVWEWDGKMVGKSKVKAKNKLLGKKGEEGRGVLGVATYQSGISVVEHIPTILITGFLITQAYFLLLCDCEIGGRNGG